MKVKQFCIYWVSSVKSQCCQDSLDFEIILYEKSEVY